MIEEKKNEALEAEGEYRTAVEEAYDYIENFDLLETTMKFLHQEKQRI